MTEEQLSALLRLKRYEQPPAQYFDRLLQDIHRRQRADYAKLPLWRIALDRIQTFFSEHSMSRLSYAGALASVTIVGVTAIGLMTPGAGVQRNGPIVDADISQPPPPIATEIEEPLIKLQGAGRALAAGSNSIRDSVPVLSSDVQRFIIDSHPVSYVPDSF